MRVCNCGLYVQRYLWVRRMRSKDGLSGVSLVFLSLSISLGPPPPPPPPRIGDVKGSERATEPGRQASTTRNEAWLLKEATLDDCLLRVRCVPTVCLWVV